MLRNITLSFRVPDSFAKAVTKGAHKVEKSRSAFMMDAVETALRQLNVEEIHHLIETALSEMENPEPRTEAP